MRRFLVALLAAALLAAGSPPADAQAQAPAAPAPAQKGSAKKDGKKGEIRVQGERLDDKTETAPRAPSAPLVDLREEMRRFVQASAAFVRSHRADFAVVAEGGLDLLVKQDETDRLKTAPARAYMQALDGILVPGLFFDDPAKPGAEPTPQRLQRRLALLENARAQRLKIMTVDFVQGADDAEEAIRRASEIGAIPFPSPLPIERINALPRFPARPYRENGESVVSFPGVRNFMIMSDSRPFGREDEYALKMHDTNFDAVIVAVFHGRLPLSRQAVETLKYKKLGSRRLVLARVDLASISAGSFFWKPNWREGSPNFIDAPVAGDPDRHRIQYWRPAWQQIVNGGPDSYLYGVIAQGFDGVMLAGLDAWYHFDSGVKDEETRP
jgi:endo-alpha-1,4-polygalactosaminidase (GH114 family)